MFHHHIDLTNGIFIMSMIYDPIIGMIIDVQYRVYTKIKFIGP